MALNKATGEMYDFVTHTHSSLAGECSHKCSYCYVNDLKRRFPACQRKYSGKPRLVASELSVKFGTGNTIFTENLNDLWATNVPNELILAVLQHCRDWPDNTYLFQTKNPDRYHAFLNQLPPKCMLGCTIESDGGIEGISLAPLPMARARAMNRLQGPFQTFVTCEPLISFSLRRLLIILAESKPNFVAIGADSKGHGLPEPTGYEVQALIDGLQRLGIEIRGKRNLDRLMKARA